MCVLTYFHEKSMRGDSSSYRQKNKSLKNSKKVQCRTFRKYDPVLFFKTLSLFAKQIVPVPPNLWGTGLTSEKERRAEKGKTE